MDNDASTAADTGASDRQRLSVLSQASLAESDLIGNILSEEAAQKQQLQQVGDVDKPLMALPQAYPPLPFQNVSLPLPSIPLDLHLYPAAESPSHPAANGAFLRSTSAPPQLSLETAAAIAVNGEQISPDDPRLTPAYYAYYYSQRPLDPRLPPPLLDYSTWAQPHDAQQQPQQQASQPPPQHFSLHSSQYSSRHPPQSSSQHPPQHPHYPPHPHQPQHSHQQLPFVQGLGPSAFGGSFNRPDHGHDQHAPVNVNPILHQPKPMAVSGLGMQMFSSQSDSSAHAASGSVWREEATRNGQGSGQKKKAVRKDRQENAAEKLSVGVASPMDMIQQDFPRTPSPLFESSAPSASSDEHPDKAALSLRQQYGASDDDDDNGAAKVQKALEKEKSATRKDDELPSLSNSRQSSQISQSAAELEYQMYQMNLGSGEALRSNTSRKPVLSPELPRAHSYDPYVSDVDPSVAFGMFSSLHGPHYRSVPPIQPAMGYGQDDNASPAVGQAQGHGNSPPALGMLPPQSVGPSQSQPMYHGHGLPMMNPQQQQQQQHSQHQQTAHSNSHLQNEQFQSHPHSYQQYVSQRHQFEERGSMHPSAGNFRQQSASLPMPINYWDTSVQQQFHDSLPYSNMRPMFEHDGGLDHDGGRQFQYHNRGAPSAISGKGRRGQAPSNVPGGRDGGLTSRSMILHELRTKKHHHNVRLSDVIQQRLVTDLATDQNGSRFIQLHLESSSVAQKQALFEQLMPEMIRLCVDVFGNYVIQKFFEFGLPQHRRALAQQLQGSVLELSLQMYGCRVVQKALEVIDGDQQAALVEELRLHITKCVKDQNGNHVIQKCIEKVPAKHIGFIVQAFVGHVFSLSTHAYGCRVIQRLLEHCPQEPKDAILSEILDKALQLVVDQYGNYVIQHVIQRGEPVHRSTIIQKIKGRVCELSKHKFASNVIEKCFAFGADDEKEALVNEVIGDDKNCPVTSMVKDQYANYVVQKILGVVNADQRDRLIETIRVCVPNLRKIAFGKHIVSRVEKLTGKVI